jgi:hypothetical protein
VSSPREAGTRTARLRAKLVGRKDRDRRHVVRDRTPQEPRHGREKSKHRRRGRLSERDRPSHGAPAGERCRKKRRRRRAVREKQQLGRRACGRNLSREKASGTSRHTENRGSGAETSASRTRQQKPNPLGRRRTTREKASGAENKTERWRDFFGREVTDGGAAWEKPNPNATSTANKSGRA